MISANVPVLSVDLRQFLKAFADGHRVVFDVAAEQHTEPHWETGKPHVSARWREDVLLSYCICLNEGWVQTMAFMQKPAGERPLVVDVIELTPRGREAAGLPPLAVPLAAGAPKRSASRPATRSLFGD